MLQTQITIPQSDSYMVGNLRFKSVSKEEVLDYIATGETKFTLTDDNIIVLDRKIKLIFEGNKRTNTNLINTICTLESRNLIKFWMPAGYNPDDRTVKSNSLTEAYAEKYISYVIDHLIPKDDNFYILLYDTSR